MNKTTFENATQVTAAKKGRGFGEAVFDINAMLLKRNIDAAKLVAQERQSEQ